MNTFSPKSTAAEYITNMGKEVLLGKISVTVCSFNKTSESGTYAKGFKVSTNTYGLLKREFKKRAAKWSADNGVTWYDCSIDVTKQRAGKIKLNSDQYTEFAVNERARYEMTMTRSQQKRLDA